MNCFIQSSQPGTLPQDYHTEISQTLTHGFSNLSSRFTSSDSFNIYLKFTIKDSPTINKGYQPLIPKNQPTVLTQGIPEL